MKHPLATSPSTTRDLSTLAPLDSSFTTKKAYNPAILVVPSSFAFHQLEAFHPHSTPLPPLRVLRGVRRPSHDGGAFLDRPHQPDPVQ